MKAGRTCIRHKIRLNRGLTFLFMLSLLFGSKGYSQGTNIKFKHVSIKDGLSQSSVNAIIQDEQGFMWFGTQDGLNKYDGYVFTVYKHLLEDSTTLVNSFVNCFYQDADGRLWIGTNGGVSIYEHKMDRFVSTGPEIELLKPLKNEQILCFGKRSDSVVLIGTEKGLYHYTIGRELHKVTLSKELLNEVGDFKVTDIVTVKEDLIWIGTSENGILEYDLKSEKWKHLKALTSGPDEDHINSNRINALCKSKRNKIFVGSDYGLNIYDIKTSKFKSYTYTEGDMFGISSNFITVIYEDHLGNVWLGTNGGGLNKYFANKGVFHVYKKNVNIESSIISNNISSVYQDNSGVLWIGTPVVGLSKFDLLKQNFNHYQFDQRSISSISRNIIWSIFTEGETMWVGSNEGLNKYERATNVNTAFTPVILVNNEKRTNAIYSLFRLNSSQLMVGTDGGVYQFNTSNSTFSPVYFGNLRITHRTYTIVEDSKNRLWIGTMDGGLYLISADRNQYRNYTMSRGLPSNIIREIFIDSDDQVYLGTDNGLCKVVENGSTLKFEVFHYEVGNSNSLRNNSILSIAEDHDGFIWVGTFGGGLNRLDKKNNLFVSYTEKDGLPNNVIYGILVDEKNNLWCSTNNGICRFNAETKSVRNFDEYDGLQSNEFNLGAKFKSESGELFFGGIKGVNSFYPSNIQINSLPPQVVITEFQLFNKPISVGQDGILSQSISTTDQINLSYSQNVFSFSFSALHYSLPERNRYAYKLEGFDENWIFDDNTRRAKYTNLDPGIYTFKVKGTNSDGIWSDQVDIMVNISPPFWRIWWVQVLAVISLLGGMVFFYISRLKVIQSQKERLEKEVELRTLEVRDQKEEIEKQKMLVEEEKEKLETLLLNVLPESTVEELKLKGRATARNYSKATVMFTDFKGFTRISESLEPTDLVAKLDSFFVKFDEVIEKYNIEKIKTIGDAYMCAGGIPIRNKSNPVDVTLAALEIQREMEVFNKESIKNKEPEWGLRLGIHTGVIIAGVIGIKRFAYDIWGDTVNVASRVETNGEVGRVNVSEATYEEVKDYFVTEYRGKIYAKNKGEIDMFFIHSIKPHLSIDGKGIEPNDTFWEYVNLNLFSPIKYHEAEVNILTQLKKKLPKNLYYHNIKHTLDVTEAVERIALNEGIHNEDLFILKMAALYHDAGFIEKYQNNESIGASMAKNDLPAYGFNEEQINLVEQLIMVTFAAKKPTTLLEKILRDADLDYLGRPDFHELSTYLKRELIERDMVRSDEHWDELQVNFLEKHKFHTDSANADREALKQKHLDEIKRRMKKNAGNKVIN